MPILVAYFPVEYINADLRCKGASVLELSEREYNEGPFIAKDGHSGLVTLDEIVHSRYAMGYDPADPTNRRHKQIAFIPLEPENVDEDITDHDTILDLGDDILSEENITGINMHPSMVRFLSK